MTHKGIEYTIIPTATPGIWEWRFWIGDEVTSGKTETKIALLATRRAQLKIDRELKKLNMR